MTKLIVWLHQLFSRCTEAIDTILSKASYTEVFLTKNRHKVHQLQADNIHRNKENITWIKARIAVGTQTSIIHWFLKLRIEVGLLVVFLRRPIAPPGPEPHPSCSHLASNREGSGLSRHPTLSIHTYHMQNDPKWSCKKLQVQKSGWTLPGSS